MNEFRCTGHSNEDGEPIIDAKDRLIQWIKANNITKFFMSITPIKVNSNTDLVRYYSNFIVASFQSAFWMEGLKLSKAETDTKLRKLSNVLWDESYDGKEWTAFLQDIEDIDEITLKLFIKECEDYGREMYNLNF